MAIKREKELKKWNRQKKENLINKKNPDWKVLVTERGFIRDNVPFTQQVNDLLKYLGIPLINEEDLTKGKEQIPPDGRNDDTHGLKQIPPDGRNDGTHDDNKGEVVVGKANNHFTSSPKLASHSERSEETQPSAIDAGHSERSEETQPTAIDASHGIDGQVFLDYQKIL